MNHSAVEAKSELSEPTMMTTRELTDIIELQSQPVDCTNASCRNTVARLKLQIRQLQRKVNKNACSYNIIKNFMFTYSCLDLLLN
jgi:hypothetical protein